MFFKALPIPLHSPCDLTWINCDQIISNWEALKGRFFRLTTLEIPKLVIFIIKWKKINHVKELYFQASLNSRMSSSFFGCTRSCLPKEPFLVVIEVRILKYDGLCANGTSYISFYFSSPIIHTNTHPLLLVHALHPTFFFSGRTSTL